MVAEDAQPSRDLPRAALLHELAAPTSSLGHQPGRAVCCSWAAELKIASELAAVRVGHPPRQDGAAAWIWGISGSNPWVDSALWGRLLIAMLGVQV